MMTDMNEIQKAMDSVKVNSDYFEKLYSDLVKEECESLDNLMSDMYVECIKDSDTVPLDMLEKYYLELSNMIYFMNTRVEKLGVMADMAKSAYNSVHNTKLIEASEVKDDKGKVRASAICTAEAEIKAYHDEIVADVYRHAYNAVKSKVASGMDMMNALRRILSTRTEEMKLANTGAGGDN